MRLSLNERTHIYLAIGLWFFVVLSGMIYISVYKLTPGENAVTQKNWPSKSKLKPSHQSNTMIVIAHPKCDCTKATLEELKSMLTSFTNEVLVYIVFIHPPGTPLDQWKNTESWKMAQAIPSAKVISDTNNTETKLFGAHTSGQTLIYNNRGLLTFNGGITAARGHIGDSLGRQKALASLLLLKNSITTHNPTFGCPLEE